MDERSMLDIAYEIIGKSKKGVKFSDLFDQICVLKEKTEEQKVSLIGRFYSDLLLDGRFFALDDNVWDLRERYSYEKSHIQVAEVVEEEETSEEDKEENKAYEAEVQGRSVEDLNSVQPENMDENPTDAEGGSTL